MITGSRCVQYSGQGGTASATDEPDTMLIPADELQLLSGRARLHARGRVEAAGYL
jgi:hypothetical protein